MFALLPTTSSRGGPRCRCRDAALRARGRAGRPVWIGLVLLAMGWAVPERVLAAEAPVVTELEVKAALLPKLAMFVRWPAAAFGDQADPLRVGIIGPNPFGPHLAAALEGKKVGDRRLKLEVCESLEGAAHCHLLYIAGRSLDDVRSVLQGLGHAPVVTVCDLPGFSAAGGMITLRAENKRVSLTINPSAMREAGLRADPQLLRIARIEGPGAASLP